MAIIPSEFEKNIVIDTPQQQKTKKLIMVFVIYFGFFSNSSNPSVDIGAMQTILPGAPSQINTVAMKQIDQNNKLLELLNAATLDSPIFKDKKFQSLILSDRLPVVIGEKGRQNPFAPF